MRKIVLTATLLGLAGCSTSQLQTACTVDAVVVPVATATATAVAVGDPAISPAVGAAIAADAPVHKQIQVDCAALAAAPTVPAKP
jgi:hypothetical protein